MKRIAFFISFMADGGVESVMVSLLNCIDYSKYSIDLYTYSWNQSNPFFKKIPSAINICFIDRLKNKNNVKTRKVKKLWFRFIARFSNTISWRRYCASHYAKLSDTYYDASISYRYEDIANALYSVYAKTRIYWSHSSLIDANQLDSTTKRLLLHFNKIFCVSLDNKNEFDSFGSRFAKKTIVVHNIVPVEEIKNKAQEFKPEFDKNQISIVSVGRLSKEKGFDRIIPITNELIRDGYDICWYIVGDGPERKTLEDTINHNDLNDRVKLLGFQENPYPYVLNCDLYVQPSYTEAYCTTTVEAKVLQKLIVVTDVHGMREQFTDGVNGIITESSVEGLLSGIKRLIDDDELQSEINKNLGLEFCNENKEIEKLYRAIA